MDTRQATFAEFEVPDRGRILKVKRWLTKHGCFDGRGRPTSVLEIGYARGGLLDLVDRGADVTKCALDINQREVDPDVRFIQHDCNEDFDFAQDGAFDVVFAGEVIEHIYDDERFLRQIHRILSPNGVLALTTPNLFFLFNRIIFPFGKMPAFAYAPYHYHIYSRRTLTELVARCGFDVKRVTSSHILVCSRGHRVLGTICEQLGNVFPSLGAHLILLAEKGSEA